MPAICSQKIVSIPYTAKLGPVQAQPPQRCHAFGLPGQMHAVTMSHVGREGYIARPLIPKNRSGHVRICRVQVMRSESGFVDIPSPKGDERMSLAVGRRPSVRRGLAGAMSTNATPA
jgi:hypothetical protein